MIIYESLTQLNMFNPVQFYEFGKSRGNAFVSTWKTDNISTGSTANNQIKLPLESSGTYNFFVNWGDGTEDNITVWNQSATTHTYSNIGTYEITIFGACSFWAFANSGDRLKFLSVSNWGTLKVRSTSAFCQGCANLNLSLVSSVLDLSGVTSMQNWFNGCSSLTTINRLTEWDTSNIQIISNMFFEASNFNQNIGALNVVNVTSMVNTFTRAFLFNNGGSTSINNWNTSNLTSLSNTFNDCNAFNQPLDNWDVSNVTNMTATFRNCFVFNQNISNWQTGLVSNFSTTFSTARAFNQNIGNWNTTNALTMASMFFGAIAFDQNIGNWNVSNVTNFTSMFQGKTPTTFSSVNLDFIYNGWSLRTVKTNIIISFSSAKYTSASSSGRAILTGTPNNWSITDGGI